MATIPIFALVNMTKSGPWSVTLPFLLRKAPSLNVDALDKLHNRVFEEPFKASESARMPLDC